MAKTKTPTSAPAADGIAIVFLPVCQAYMVMHHGIRLWGPIPQAEAIAVVRELRMAIARDYPAGRRVCLTATHAAGTIAETLNPDGSHVSLVIDLDAGPRVTVPACHVYPEAL